MKFTLLVFSLLTVINKLCFTLKSCPRIIKDENELRKKYLERVAYKQTFSYQFWLKITNLSSDPICFKMNKKSKIKICKRTMEILGVEFAENLIDTENYDCKPWYFKISFNDNRRSKDILKCIIKKNEVQSALYISYDDYSFNNKEYNVFVYSATTEIDELSLYAHVSGITLSKTQNWNNCFAITNE